MGCPANSNIEIGILISYKQAEKLKAELEKLNEQYPEDDDYQKFVGPIGEDNICMPCYGEGQCYVKLTPNYLYYCDNCSHAIGIDLKKIQSAFDEVWNKFFSIPFLVKHFKNPAKLSIILTCDHE